MAWGGHHICRSEPCEAAFVCLWNVGCVGDENRKPGLGPGCGNSRGKHSCTPARADWARWACVSVLVLRSGTWPCPHSPGPSGQKEQRGLSVPSASSRPELWDSHSHKEQNIISPAFGPVEGRRPGPRYTFLQLLPSLPRPPMGLGELTGGLALSWKNLGRVAPHCLFRGQLGWGVELVW